MIGKQRNSAQVISVDGITINVEFHCVTCGVSITARVLWRQYREMEQQWLGVHAHNEVEDSLEGATGTYRGYAPSTGKLGD